MFHVHIILLSTFIYTSHATATTACNGNREDNAHECQKEGEICLNKKCHDPCGSGWTIAGSNPQETCHDHAFCNQDICNAECSQPKSSECKQCTNNVACKDTFCCQKGSTAGGANSNVAGNPNAKPAGHNVKQVCHGNREDNAHECQVAGEVCIKEKCHDPCGKGWTIVGVDPQEICHNHEFCVDKHCSTECATPKSPECQKCKTSTQCKDEFCCKKN